MKPRNASRKAAQNENCDCLTNLSWRTRRNRTHRNLLSPLNPLAYSWQHLNSGLLRRRFAPKLRPKRCRESRFCSAVTMSHRSVLIAVFLARDVPDRWLKGMLLHKARPTRANEQQQKLGSGVFSSRFLRRPR